MKELQFREAIAEAMSEEMRLDENVFFSLSNAISSLFAETKAISIPEKNAEKINEIIITK